MILTLTLVFGSASDLFSGIATAIAESVTTTIELMPVNPEEIAPAGPIESDSTEEQENAPQGELPEENPDIRGVKDRWILVMKDQPPSEVQRQQHAGFDGCPAPGVSYRFPIDPVEENIALSNGATVTIFTNHGAVCLTEGADGDIIPRSLYLTRRNIYGI